MSNLNAYVRQCGFTLKEMIVQRTEQKLAHQSRKQKVTKNSELSEPKALGSREPTKVQHLKRIKN